MKIHGHSRVNRRRESGQILPLFVLWIVVLIPFVGLSIDLGFAYVTKAQLSKAVDAAALAGISNLYQGQGTAQNIAISTFKANFAPSGTLAGRYVAMPSPNVSFTTDGNGNQFIQVQATATINTFFIRVLPAIGGANWSTLAVGDTGQATRSPVIMTLVLDHSFSMSPNCNIPGGGCTGGGTFLPPAVKSFIGDFIENVDRAAVVSFGSSVTNEVPMTTTFKNPITTDMNYAINNPNNYWNGYTCSEVALTNALNIELNNNSTQSTVKVVVFFTDGLANGIEANLTCPTVNGCTPSNPSGYVQGRTNRWNLASLLGTTTVEFFQTNMLNNSDQHNSPCCEEPTSCCNGSNYPIGGSKPINYTNIQSDATNRCILVANQMRAAGMYVYSIGLDDAGNGDVPNSEFLQEVANDPGSSVYNPSMPSGVALTTQNGADIAQLFQQIAGDIQLRLTH